MQHCSTSKFIVRCTLKSTVKYLHSIVSRPSYLLQWLLNRNGSPKLEKIAGNWYLYTLHYHTWYFCTVNLFSSTSESVIGLVTTGWTNFDDRIFAGFSVSCSPWSFQYIAASTLLWDIEDNETFKFWRNIVLLIAKGEANFFIAHNVFVRFTLSNDSVPRNATLT